MKKKEAGDRPVGAVVVGLPDSPDQDLWRVFAQGTLDAMEGFKAPKFSSDSLEVKRADHADRVSMLEFSVEKVKSRAKELLTRGLDQQGVDEWTEEMRELKRAAEAIFCAETLAWKELAKRLDDALKDPRIEFNPETTRFVNSMLDLVNRAAGHWDFDQVLKPIESRLRSEHARSVAVQKNALPRAWVCREWANRTDDGQSKAAFARQYAPLVKKRFDLDVTTGTIERDWLPKG